MNETSTVMESTTNAIKQNASLLGTCALVASILLGITFVSTEQRIMQSERALEQRALLEVVESIPHDNDLLNETLSIPAQYQPLLGVSADAKVHLVRNGADTVGYIIPAISGDGYGGNIKLIVGLTVAGELSGVRVIQHTETPGLGDKIELKKSQWILSFNGKTLFNPSADEWKVRKDGGIFDAFTGATITPRAVVGQVLKVLRYYQEDQTRLIKASGVYTPTGAKTDV